MWASWLQVKWCEGILAPSWLQVGAKLGPSYVMLGPSWGQVGAKLGPCWAKLGPSWTKLGQVEAKLGPSWAKLGPSWAKLGQVAAKLGPGWGQVGPSWAALPGGPSKDKAADIARRTTYVGRLTLPAEQGRDSEHDPQDDGRADEAADMAN